MWFPQASLYSSNVFYFQYLHQRAHTLFSEEIFPRLPIDTNAEGLCSL